MEVAGEDCLTHFQPQIPFGRRLRESNHFTSDLAPPSNPTHAQRSSKNDLKMGLRNLLGCSLAVLLLSCAEANYRQRRQSLDSTFYQPPLLLNNAPQPQPQQNSYQPPISRPSNSFEYRSPLEYSSSGHQSVQYVPHDTSQSFSVHQQQPSSSIGSSERTSKVVGSSSSVQAIHKAPASEIEAKKESLAKEKDAAKDEYVVYYYYYYDNDTAANNLSSSNFDDIPSLESFDDAKEPERIQTNLGNSVDDSRNLSSQARSAASQASDAFIRADRQPQPLKPVSNVFRYGSNEVPRFPVLPNFVVSEVSTTTTTEGPTPMMTSEIPTTMSSPDVEEDDAVNSVLDNATDLKEAKSQEVEETTTTTTTEPPTTTEEETTTTERPTRRRPSIGGSRRRFNPNPSTATSPNRGRNPPSRSSTSTSSTSTTTTAAPTRRSFQGSNRVRSRQPSSRTRTTSDSEDRTPSRSTTESTTTSSTTARSRFTSAAPRRFQSNRSRSQTSSSTTSTSTTTRSPSASSPARSRPTSRPRPNLISRNRPPRPGFLRPRQEETVAETTTATPAEAEETSPANEAASTAEEEDSEEEASEEEEEEEAEEQAATTESNRFSALFRPRNRNALNRPRPAIGNRPSRS